MQIIADLQLHSKHSRAISLRMRERDIFIDPCYDGIFGKVKIFKENEKKETIQQALF